MEEGKAKVIKPCKRYSELPKGRMKPHRKRKEFFVDKELSSTSQAMAESMSQISSAMQALQSYNTQLRVTSREVETRAEFRA